jgi:translation elongation factor EF-G
MSKLEKLPIFFVTIETLVNMYKQNEDMRFENLGVITDQRIPVCQVYYPEKKLIPNPYTLQVNKENIIKWRQKIVQFIIDDIEKSREQYKNGEFLTEEEAEKDFEEWLKED